jgi:sugar-specific transcriptional regulator TrmB
MCKTLGPVTRRRILEKRRWPAEVQAAIDEFEREFGALSRGMRERLAEAIIARNITPEGDINAAVRRVISEDRDELNVVLTEGATTGAAAGRRMASRRFGLEIDFEQVPQRTLNELENFVDDIDADVLETIGEGVADTLERRFEEGLPRDEIADIMREELDNELGEAAAQRHARTLVQGASERGNHSAIRDSSAIAERWVATADSRTRDTHAAADGQIVPVETTFRVGGAELMHPGDPGGPISEIVNCRCFTQPVFESDLSADERAAIRSGRRLNV